MPEIVEPPKTSVDAFKMLFNIENAFREFIVEEMTRTCGARWHKSRLPSDVAQKYLEAKQYERRTKWITLIPHHPIYYIDFPDLKKIVEQNNNWREIFSPLFIQKTVTTDALFSIEPIRNAVAHNRLLSGSDLDQLRGSYQKLQNLLVRSHSDYDSLVLGSRKEAGSG
jgi:hypothetical protein